MKRVLIVLLVIMWCAFIAYRINKIDTETQIRTKRIWSTQQGGTR